jgi:hypothetical protein
MSDLGDEYAKAAQELAKLTNRHQAAAMGGEKELAATLQDEVLAQLDKVESLYGRLRAEYSKRMSGS